jgi:hypothetical protein
VARRSYAYVLVSITAVAVSAGFSLPVAHAQSAIEAKSAQALLPRPYVVEQQLAGDLDKDGDADVVLLGVDGPAVADEDTVGDGDRILIVARRNKSSFTLVGKSTSAVLCRRCGGAFWGGLPAPVDLALNKGVLVVKQEAGAREVNSWTHRYRVEGSISRLIGLDELLYDRGSGGEVSVSTNYLTGVTITRVTGQVENAPKPGTVKGKPRTIRLERVTLEQTP